MARTLGERRMRLVFRRHRGPAELTARKVGFCGLDFFFYFWAELVSGKELRHRCEHPTLTFLVALWRVLTACPRQSSMLCREDASHLPGVPAKQLLVVSSNSSSCRFLSLVFHPTPLPSAQASRSRRLTSPTTGRRYQPARSGLAGIRGSSHGFKEADLS